MKKIIAVFIFILSLIHLQQIYAQWQLLTGLSGGGTSYIINPKPNTLIVRTNIGLYKSTDGSVSWRCLFNGPGDIFRPTGTTLIGKENNILFSVYGHVIGAAKIYLSTDCGDHWTALPGAQRMISAAFKDNYIFYSRNVSGSEQEGIFRSSDNGITWSHLPPFNYSGKLFVKDNYVFYMYHDTLYRSSDNGDSWNAIHYGTLNTFTSYNNLILAYYNTYLYKSSDYGVTWDSLSMSFNPYKLLTQDSTLFAMDSWDYGFYRSTDIGSTWQRVSNNVPQVNDFCFDNNSIYITNSGVRRSTDFGNSWTYRDSGITVLGVQKVFADSSNIFAFSSNSLSVSNNNGQSWSNIYDSSIIKGGNQTFAALNSNYFIAADSGLYKSSDKGHTWINIKGSIMWGADNTIGKGFGQLFLYTPAAGLLKSTDLGASWITLPSFPGSNIKYFLEHNNNLFVYTTENHGIYRSGNQGNNWVLCYNGINDTTAAIQGMTYSMNDLYCITSHNIYKSTDEGNEWVNVSSGSIGSINNYLYGITASAGYVYAAEYQNGVFASSNGGTNWVLSTDGLLNDYVYSITSNSSHVFVSTLAGTDYVSGVFRIASGTIPVQTYTVSGNVTFADNFLPVETGYVKALKYDRQNDKVITLDSSIIQPNGDYVLPHVPPDTAYIMAYDDDEETFTPTYHDSSINWQYASVVVPSGNMTNINIKVYRIVTGFLNMHIGGGVFKSQEKDLIGLKDAIIYAKAFGQYRGYSFSNSNGAYRIDSLFPGIYQLTCDRLGYSPQYKNITLTYYSSDTTNFYLTIFTEIKKISTDLPQEYKLEQCYPNPFNPKTTIKFGIPKASDVKLVIYDILGKEVAVLFNEKMNAGVYTAEWDASMLASGVYFYRLSANDFISVKKMVLIK